MIQMVNRYKLFQINFDVKLMQCFCEWRCGFKLSRNLATMKHYKKFFLVKQLLERFFHFILIFFETNSRLRTQTLKSLPTSCFDWKSLTTFTELFTNQLESKSRLVLFPSSSFAKMKYVNFIWHSSPDLMTT